MALDPKNLGAPLEAHAAAFSAASNKRMADANEVGAPKMPLYHYTSEQAFKSIVESNEFWFTSIYHMDDTEELNFGFGVAGSIWKEVFDSGEQVLQLFCEEFLAPAYRDEVRRAVEFYSVSFGSRDDLKQWQSYGDGSKGVAFGLAPRFFEPVNIVAPKPEEMIFAAKVVYGPSDARARHLPVIQAATDLILNLYKAGAIPNSEVARALFQRLAAECYVEILWNCVTSKDTKWSRQEEFRLLALNRLNAPHLKIENAAVRPRVELPQPNLRRDMVEVMVGPEADAEAEERVRAFLHSHGMTHVAVSRSVSKP